MLLAKKIRCLMWRPYKADTGTASAKPRVVVVVFVVVVVVVVLIKEG
jgi:hypothetical protein